LEFNALLRFAAFRAKLFTITLRKVTDLFQLLSQAKRASTRRNCGDGIRAERRVVEHEYEAGRRMPRNPSKPPVVILPFIGKKPKLQHPTATPTAPAQPTQPPRYSPGPPADRNPGDAGNQRAMLFETFGGRLRIDEQRGFFLDGRPIDYRDLMRKAKQLRITSGLSVEAKYWRHW
jgi:hypothetical protein